MAESPDLNTLISIAGAVGAAVAAFLSGLTRKSSKDSATGIDHIQTALGEMSKQLSSLASRFDAHEGAILVRVGALEHDGERFRDQLYALVQRTQEAIAKLESLGLEKTKAHEVLWQAMDEIRRDLKRLEIQAPRWGGDEA